MKMLFASDEMEEAAEKIRSDEDEMSGCSKSSGHTLPLPSSSKSECFTDEIAAMGAMGAPNKFAHRNKKGTECTINKRGSSEDTQESHGSQFYNFMGCKLLYDLDVDLQVSFLHCLFFPLLT